MIDHVSAGGVVKARAFYSDTGWKESEIHTTDHGNPKHHPFGTHGEHIHFYTWDIETGRLIDNKRKELSAKVRKENDDIL